MGADRNGDEQITGRAAVLSGVALPPDGDGLAIVDTCGDLGLNGPALALQPLPRQDVQGVLMMRPLPPQRPQGEVVAKTPMGVCRRTCT